MGEAERQRRDPLGWCIAISLAFLALGWHRLGLPSKPYFDEVHYVPAARNLLQLVSANLEHPMFGKEMIAASIALLGDRPTAWRAPSLLFGSFGLFAFGRLIWWTSRRRFATVAGMVLLATNFVWFVQSRIAMLDIFAASLALAGLWLFASSLHLPPRRARWRFAFTGVLMGLSLGAKWSVLPLMAVPALAFLDRRWREAEWQRRPAITGKPARISLLEAGFWLWLLPLLVYWGTFAPGFFYSDQPVSPLGFVEHHRHMIALQGSVTTSHPYQSVWHQWIANWRPIWYLYEEADGAQRGVLLLGNPFTMLAGLFALAWCLWTGLVRQNRPALGFALLYFACLGLWLLAAKPIQFYYHYLLPATFLMGCLALGLDALMRKGGAWRAVPIAALLVSVGHFVWFYPILSAAALADGPQAFLKWTWLDSWR